jgi:hypothetical protein
VYNPGVPEKRPEFQENGQSSGKMTGIQRLDIEKVTNQDQSSTLFCLVIEEWKLSTRVAEMNDFVERQPGGLLL